MSHVDVQMAANRLLDELERAIVGKRQVLELIVSALLADGHILLEDVPGVAKTAIARSLAEAAGLHFSRVQFTPDLIPADITGATVLSGPDGATTFQPGPVFANLVLGDEINRAPPKTQSALLEAMEERQVTADAVTRPLPVPFLVIGTQNPIEQEGTYPLPEAQLDRFLIRTDIGYPGRDYEIELLIRRAERAADRMTLNPVLTRDDVIGLQKRVEQVYVSRPVARYVVDLVEATRNSPRTEAGASPRGSLALLKAGRARAAMAGRSHVLPDDVKAVAEPCLAHRLLLQPDQWVRGVRTEQVIREIVSQVPAPQSIDPADSRRPDPAAQRRPPAGYGDQRPSGPLSGNQQEQVAPNAPRSVPPMPPGQPVPGQGGMGGGFVPGERSWGQGFDPTSQTLMAPADRGPNNGGTAPPPEQRHQAGRPSVPPPILEESHPGSNPDLTARFVRPSPPADNRP
jgi:MoxR-like ATPase